MAISRRSRETVEGYDNVPFQFCIEEGQKNEKLKLVGGWNANEPQLESETLKSIEPHPIDRQQHSIRAKSAARLGPIEAYKQRVKSALDQKASNCEKRITPQSVDVSAALSCLRQTTPSLKLEYPSDADSHMNEIRIAMAKWAQHSGHKMHR